MAKILVLCAIIASLSAVLVAQVFQGRVDLQDKRFCKLDTAIVTILVSSLSGVTKPEALEHYDRYLGYRIKYQTFITSITDIAPCTIEYTFPPDPTK